jgi:hypothetical protein
MPSSITALANLTLGSNATSVTFSSIVGSYRDLLLVCTYTNGVSDNDNIAVKINSDTGSNYSTVTMSGNGSGTNSSTYNSSSYGWLAVQGGFQTSRGQIRVNFFDYAQTDKHKSYLARNDTFDKGVESVAGRWASTSAIDTLNIYSVNGWTFATGSTFALYGIGA